MVQGTAGDHIRLGLLVGNLVDGSTVEGEDLRAGIAEENRGVGGDEELGVAVIGKGAVDEGEEGELAGGGEGGFGLVE